MSLQPACYHLLGLLAGERFRVHSDPAGIFEVIELPPDKPEGEPRLAFMSQAGDVLRAAEVADLNDGSFFVLIVPALTPPREEPGS